ncbi:hypothetical protein [Paraburkholderia humisilvae]|uniref:Uncharacterized protein n=1 Tax=Paraburkholderia humisilvae TaxID=627669 RepID=A0A6J5DL45_9BURK|nr:hypothetical protein [Paraburkholderia humisilvae]CAB3754909.1 hypothetical protein LMG29542_02486 [Paraburkholderia humisilvae]
MVFATNLLQYLLQLTYWMGLAVLVKWLYIDTVRNMYAFSSGKAIGACGAAIALLGLDSCGDAFFRFVRDSLGERPDAYDPGVWERMYRVHGITHLPVDVAGSMLLVGGALVYWGVFSWRFTRPEMKDVRLADRAQAKADEDAKNRFIPAGELVSIRTTVAKGGLLSSTERFTEIETTDGVLIVSGEVGSIAKGVPVYRNGWDKVRIGGLHSRTFDIRHV